MFVLVEMKDTVRIPPWLFNVKFNDAIVEALNKKFANKVVHNVGLCIALWDITNIEDSFIFPGDGASHSVVHFRYVVFRPFTDEILVGKTKSCSKDGVHVSMGFFDDILIPSDAMQHPSRFDDKEQLWAWAYEADGEKHDLFMDMGEEIRFRVVDETFVDTTPTGLETTAGELAEIPDPDTKKSPYTIILHLFGVQPYLWVPYHTYRLEPLQSQAWDYYHGGIIDSVKELCSHKNDIIWIQKPKLTHLNS